MKYKDFAKKAQQDAFRKFILECGMMQNLDCLLANPNLSWEDIEANPDENWCPTFAKNPNINIRIVKNNPHITWVWFYLSSNSSIKWQDIIDNPDLPWDWSGISINPNVTEEIIMANPNLNWDWHSLAFNPNIGWNLVKSNLDKNWNWARLSCHPNISIEIIEADTNDKFLKELIPHNPNFKLADILKYSHLNFNTFNTFNVFKNFDMAKEDISIIPKDKWCWVGISANPTITEEFITANIEKLNFYELSRNPAVGWNIIKNNINRNWDWANLSANPNITYQIIKDNPTKPWFSTWFCKNTFDFQNKLIEEQCQREWQAATVVKRNWVRVFWNPEYKIGRKRLLRSLEKEEYTVW